MTGMVFPVRMLTKLDTALLAMLSLIKLCVLAVLLPSTPDSMSNESNQKSEYVLLCDFIGTVYPMFY
jgi:hypothetical protein